MSLRNYNITKLNFSKRYFPVPIIFIVFVLLFYLVYNEIKDKTINEFNNEQLILAQAASQGITSFFQNYQYELTFLSQHKCIIDFNDDTKVLMASFYNNHKNLIEAVTRVDVGGKILFTYPYNNSAIGQDISYQKHVHQVLTTHQTVISDVFMSVQGYLAVAMHVPVFKGKEFKGSIGILIQIDKLGKQYLEKIKLRGTSNAWLLSENGIEIFCLIKGHTGKSFLDLAHKDSLAIEIMEKLKKENQGTANSIHEENNGNQQNKIVEKYMVFYRVPLGSTYWTIMISYNEEEIYAALNSFRNRLILIFTFLFIVMIYYFYSLTKVRTFLNEEAKRKKAEKTLYDSEERFKTIFYDHSAVKLLIDSETGNIADANIAASKFYGWTIEELKRMKIFQINILPPDEIKKEMESTKNKEKNYLEFKHRRADGSIRDVGVYSGLISVGGKNYLHSIIHDITLHKQAEEAMRKIEREKETILDSLEEHVVHEDIDMKILWANKAACESVGLTREQLVGRYCYEIWPKRSEVCPDCPVQKAMKTNQIQEVEKLTPDGKSWFIRGYPQQDEKGNIVGGIEVTMEITERKKTEELMKQSELKYKRLFNDDLTGNFVISLDGTIELCNPAMAKIFGFDSVDELMKSNISEFYKNKKDREKLLDLIREKKKVERYEQEHITHDGRVISLIKNVIGEFDENGVLTRLKGYLFDDTERKRAEDELQKKEKRYRTLFNVSPSGIVLADLDGIIIDLNESFCKSVLYTRDELIGKNIRILVPKQNHTEVEKNTKEILSGNIVEHVVKNIKKDGTLCDMELRESLVSLPDGRKGILTAVNDITERKLAEEKNIILANALKSVNECVSITDAENKFIFVNQSFLKTYGYTEDELIGKHLNIVRSQNNSSELVEQILPNTLREGWQGELWNKRKDGSEFPIHLSTKAFDDKDGNHLGRIGVALDITERKLVEKELIKAKEKAEESNILKDAFIANMSHEIRTPLGGILGLSNIIKGLYAEHISQEDEELFTGIEHSSKRIIRTVDMILNYSRIQTGEFPISLKQLTLYSICENLVREFRNAFNSKLLKLSLENRCSKTTTIFGDEYSITNAISNLIDNAIKYTNKGFINIILYKGNNDEVLLDIEDSGIGIGEEYINHIFDPYQQENVGYGRAYEGVGLGLSIVKKFLDLNNADIFVKSEKGKGSTFTINFGKALKASEEKINVKKTSVISDKQETTNKPLVLIVEDDSVNQMTIKIFLRNLYNTFIADSAEGALEIIKNNKVDLILMDISIKGNKNGLELTKELKASKEYSKIPVIALTAHAFDTDRENSFKAGCEGYISKPFLKEVLLETIGRFL